MRVLPAQQGLHRAHLAGGQVDLRLVVQPELVALQCLAQLAVDRDAGRGIGVHSLLEVGMAAAAAVLGEVERDVGLLQQVGAALPVPWENRDADAGAGVDDVAVDLERLVQGLDQGARDRAGIAPLLQPGQHHRELVAAEAGDDVDVAHGAADARRGVPQQHVAGGVAEGVVGPLETVEVDVQHRQHRVVAAGVRHLLRQHVRQVVTVGQAGQAVEVRLVVQLLVARDRRQGDSQAVDHAGQRQRLFARQRGLLVVAEDDHAPDLAGPGDRQQVQVLGAVLVQHGPVAARQADRARPLAQGGVGAGQVERAGQFVAQRGAVGRAQVDLGAVGRVGLEQADADDLDARDLVDAVERDLGHLADVDGGQDGPVDLGECRQRAEVQAELGAHRVERFRHLAELVAVGHRHRRAEVAGRDAAHAVEHRVQRQQDAADLGEAHQQDQQHRQEGDRQEGPAEHVRRIEQQRLLPGGDDDDVRAPEARFGVDDDGSGLHVDPVDRELRHAVGRRRLD